MTAISTFASAHLAEWEGYEGLILGIQQDNTNKGHACYLSFLDIENQVAAIQQFVTDLQTQAANGETQGNAVAQSLTTNVWYMPGTYFQIGKRYMETMSLFFTTYK